MKAKPKVGDRICFDMTERKRTGGGEQRHMEITAVDETTEGVRHVGIATFKDLATGKKDCFIYKFSDGFNTLFVEG
jgi:hypothetical protein